MSTPLINSFATGLVANQPKTNSSATLYVTLLVIFVVCLLVLVLDTLWPHWVLAFLIPAVFIGLKAYEYYSN